MEKEKLRKSGDSQDMRQFQCIYIHIYIYIHNKDVQDRNQSEVNDVVDGL